MECSALFWIACFVTDNLFYPLLCADTAGNMSQESSGNLSSAAGPAVSGIGDATGAGVALNSFQSKGYDGDANSVMSVDSMKSASSDSAMQGSLGLPNLTAGWGNDKAAESSSGDSSGQKGLRTAMSVDFSQPSSPKQVCRHHV